MSTDADRLNAIHEELNAILEARITELMARSKAVRDVTGRIVEAEAEVRRQDALRIQLDAELAPLGARQTQLETENAELKAKVDAARAQVERLRRLREEQQSILSGLTSEIKGLAGT